MKMKYYQANDKLIQFNKLTGVYKVRNTIIYTNKTFTEYEFETLNALEIKKTKFCELMNVHFKEIEHHWQFKTNSFKKLDNFDKDGNSSGFNLRNLPNHIINVKSIALSGKVSSYEYNDLKFVYHWGKVYYLLYPEYYGTKGQLVDVVTHQFVQWVDIRHLAPIFNIETKSLI